MKKLIILILILIIMGLYFFTDTTKEVLKKTGHATKEISYKMFNDFKNMVSDYDIDKIKNNLKENN